MAAEQAKDGMSDVPIRSEATPEPDPGSGRLLVVHEAVCRWCPESFSTADVRRAVKWADEHEEQQYHKDIKSDRIHSGVGPRQVWY